MLIFKVHQSAPLAALQLESLWRWQDDLKSYLYSQVGMLRVSARAALSGCLHVSRALLHPEVE